MNRPPSGQGSIPGTPAPPVTPTTEPRRTQPMTTPAPPTDEELRRLAHQVWRQTLLLHRRAPETRVASSLSAVEILTALYHGPVLRVRPGEPGWPHRDRLIVSKGHGGIALYPILAELGFFPPHHLEQIAQPDALLGVIPGAEIPGIETTNGALGLGLGLGAGMALALRLKGIDASVWVMCGDGELNAGVMWEAVMFAAHHRLDNLILVVDDNLKSMLGPQKEILGLAPLAGKFTPFGWEVEEGDGHDVVALRQTFTRLAARRGGRPKAFIAHTVKGRGVPELEASPIAHVLNLAPQRVDALLEERP